MGQAVSETLQCTSFCVSSQPADLLTEEEEKSLIHTRPVVATTTPNNTHLTVDFGILSTFDETMKETATTHQTKHGGFDWGYSQSTHREISASPLAERPHWSTPNIGKNFFASLLEADENTTEEVVNWDPDVICEFIHENITRATLEFLWYEYDVGRTKVLGHGPFTELMRKILSEYVHRQYSAEAVEIVRDEIIESSGVMMRNLARTLASWDQDPAKIYFEDYQDFFLDLISSVIVVPFDKRDLYERMCTAPAISGRPYFDDVDVKQRMDAALAEPDIEKISRLLLEMTFEQRQVVMQAYPANESLITQIKTIINAKGSGIANPKLIQSVVSALLRSPIQLDCIDIRNALHNGKGRRVDTSLLIDIICTRCNTQLQEIQMEYEILFGLELTADIMQRLSDPVMRSVFIRTLKLQRKENYRVDQEQCRMDAEMLKLNIDDEKNVDTKDIVDVFCERSWVHLHDITFHFDRKSDSLTMPFALRKIAAITTPFGKWIDTVLTMAHSPRRYFARQLHETMSARRPDLPTIERYLLARAEMDADDIQVVFGQIYGSGQSLRQRLDDATPAGLYKEILMVLAGYKTKWLTVDRDREAVENEADEYEDENIGFETMHADQSINLIALRGEIEMDEDEMVGEEIDVCVEMIDSPTVLDAENFSQQSDATMLDKAFTLARSKNKTKSKKLKKTMASLLCYRSCAQRKMIRDMYHHRYARDLIEDVNTHFTGEVRALFRELLKTRGERLASSVKEALDKADIGMMVKVICELTNTEARELSEAYPSDLPQTITEELQGRNHLASLLSSIVAGQRIETTGVNEHEALMDALRLREACEVTTLLGKVNEAEFVRILSTTSLVQIYEIARMYQTISRYTLTGAMKMSGFSDSHVGQGCVIIVEMAIDRHAFFARKLRDAQKIGVLGSRHNAEELIRLIVSRSEMDLGFIIRSFNETHEKGNTFQKWLSSIGNTTFMYSLLALCGLELGDTPTEKTVSPSSSATSPRPSIIAVHRDARDRKMARAVELSRTMTDAPMKKARIKEIMSGTGDGDLATVDEIFDFMSFAVFCETRLTARAKQKLWLRWVEDDGKMDADMCKAVVEFIALAYYGYELKSNHGVQKLSGEIKDDVRRVVRPFVKWFRRVKFQVRKSGWQDEGAFLGREDYIEVIVTWIREFEETDERMK